MDRKLWRYNGTYIKFFTLPRLWVHCVPNFSLCCQPLWRFVDDVEDERLLVYRSEDIKDVSRLQSPKVCGYLKLNEDELLPKGLEDRKQNEGECPYLGRGVSLKQFSFFNSLWGWRGEAVPLMPLKATLYFCALCSRSCSALWSLKESILSYDGVLRVFGLSFLSPLLCQQKLG